jgi:hypothetical protein
LLTNDGIADRHDPVWFFARASCCAVFQGFASLTNHLGPWQSFNCVLYRNTLRNWASSESRSGSSQSTHAIQAAFRFAPRVTFAKALARARVASRCCKPVDFRNDLHARARTVDAMLTVPRSFWFFYGHSCSQPCEGANASRGANTGFSVHCSSATPKNRTACGCSLKRKIFIARR